MNTVTQRQLHGLQDYTTTDNAPDYLLNGVAAMTSRRSNPGCQPTDLERPAVRCNICQFADYISSAAQNASFHEMIFWTPTWTYSGYTAGFKKTRVFFKAQPSGFWGFFGQAGKNR